MAFRTTSIVFAAACAGTVLAGSNGTQHLRGTQGDWFSYESDVALFAGSTCADDALVGVKDPSDCVTVNVIQSAGVSNLSLQAMCSTDGSTVTVTMCVGTDTCGAPQCVTKTLYASMCAQTVDILGTPMSLRVSCHAVAPMPLFLGVVAGGAILVCAAVALCCWMDCRVRRSASARELESSLELRKALLASDEDVQRHTHTDALMLTHVCGAKHTQAGMPSKGREGTSSTIFEEKYADDEISVDSYDSDDSELSQLA